MSEKYVAVTVEFRVTDEGLITRLADDRFKELNGPDADIMDLYDPRSPLAARVAEYLLHSNPGVCPEGYLVYGLEHMRTSLWESG